MYTYFDPTILLLCVHSRETSACLRPQKGVHYSIVYQHEITAIRAWSVMGREFCSLLYCLNLMQCIRVLFKKISRWEKDFRMNLFLEINIHFYFFLQKCISSLQYVFLKDIISQGLWVPWVDFKAEWALGMAEFWADLMAWTHRKKAKAEYKRGILQRFWRTVGYPDLVFLHGNALFLPRLSIPFPSSSGVHVLVRHTDHLQDLPMSILSRGLKHSKAKMLLQGGHSQGLQRPRQMQSALVIRTTGHIHAWCLPAGRS